MGTGRLWETSEWEGEKRWGAGEARERGGRAGGRWAGARVAQGRQEQGVGRTEGGGGGSGLISVASSPTIQTHTVGGTLSRAAALGGASRPVTEPRPHVALASSLAAALTPFRDALLDASGRDDKTHAPRALRPSEGALRVGSPCGERRRAPPGVAARANKPVRLSGSDGAAARGLQYPDLHPRTNSWPRLRRERLPRSSFPHFVLPLQELIHQPSRTPKRSLPYITFS